MNKLLKLGVFTILAVCLAAPAVPRAVELKRIAVLDLTQEGTKQEAEAIAEELRKILVKSKLYVVIDRTLTTQILKEWETQRSGLTDSEKAVKIGKLYNVQLIVSGKLNKFASGGWQVSVVMLDAQSGIATKAETVRHRGDFFSLLDEKVPALGRALVGMAPARRAAANAVKKIAIYPAFYGGKFRGRFKRNHQKFLATVKKVAGKQFSGKAKIVRTFPFARGKGRGDDGEIVANSWGLDYSDGPKEKFIFRSGKSLGLDLVFVYALTRDRRSEGEYNVYILDIANLRQYSSSGHWNQKAGPALKNGIKEVIGEYLGSR